MSVAAAAVDVPRGFLSVIDTLVMGLERGLTQVDVVPVLLLILGMTLLLFLASAIFKAVPVLLGTSLLLLEGEVVLVVMLVIAAVLDAVLLISANEFFEVVPAVTGTVSLLVLVGALVFAN